MTGALKPSRLSRAEQLASRRARLREQCDIQRRHLGAIAADLQYELSGIDRAVLMMRRVASKPVVVSAAVALLTLVGPKRTLRWVTKGAFLYNAGKKVLALAAAHPQLAAGLQSAARNLLIQKRS
jgi:hypothetical protein